MIILAGDAGGTKTDLALVTSDRGPRNPIVEATFASRGYPSLEAMIGEFLAGRPESPDRVVIGVAGPVVAGHAHITNLPWAVDCAMLRQVSGSGEVILMNDLEAIAAAVPHLERGDVATLHDRVPEPGGAIGVIAPGTGLGEAFLVWDGARYRAHPSEGGHADFAPRDARQARLLEWLRLRWGHVSYERVCAGMAVGDLFRFVREVEKIPPCAAVAALVEQPGDPTPGIVEAALRAEAPCPAAQAALGIFIDTLAAEAGNLALKVLAAGGIFVAGGMPRRILSLLQQEGFRQIFRDKGRFSALVDRIPVNVVTNPKVGLLGAIWRGLEESGSLPLAASGARDAKDGTRSRRP